MLRTPLYDLHRELGARLVPFSGFEMPVMYTSILEEHQAVRGAVGLFDVSHMSNLLVRDDGARLSRALLCDASRIPPGGSKYSAVLRENGTILDDLYVFHLASGFHLVPNAGMNEVVAEHVAAASRLAPEDVSRATCILAIQGPRAQQALQPALDLDLATLKAFRCGETRIEGAPGFVSRTGYTGEDGFEIFCGAEHGERIFRRLLTIGAPQGIRPCGLGARDTLRLEKGYALAGHEFEGGRTPLEAGLDRFIHWEHEFVGRKALEAQRASGAYDRLVGILVDRGIPRQGSEIRVEGATAGRVTSGTMSPTLSRGIALGYVESAHSKIDTTLEVITRGASSPARVAKLPFVA